MKNSNQSESADYQYEPLVTAEAEAVFRSAVANEEANGFKEGDSKPSDRTGMEIVPTSVQVEDDFEVGTREEVNGAAAAFFAAGFLFFGPLIGIVAGAYGSHAAANKTGPIANFARSCGRLVDGIGKDKKNQRQTETSQAIVVAQPQGRPKGLWSKITDELVHGAAYVEGRIFPNAAQ